MAEEKRLGDGEEPPLLSERALTTAKALVIFLLSRMGNAVFAIRRYFLQKTALFFVHIAEGEKRTVLVFSDLASLKFCFLKLNKKKAFRFSLHS
jgi:hypothetical protein